MIFPANQYNAFGSIPQIPMQQSVTPINQMGSQLIRVNGIESAKAYPTTPNSMVALFDENDDVMYIKSTDASNFPTIRTFKFTEVKDEPKHVPSDPQYVTKEEFEELKQEILNVKQSIRNAEQPDAELSKSKFNAGKNQTGKKSYGYDEGFHKSQSDAQ